MVNKLIFKSVIDKYHLGENESVKWITRNKQLTIDFMSLSKEVIGRVVHDGFDLEDSDLAIFDTKKLLNLISITSGDLLLTLEKNKSVFTKLHLADNAFNLTYALADPLLIGKVGTVNSPEWDATATLEKEDIFNLVKAKGALGDVNNMLISTGEDANGDNIILFTFGDENGHNNKITYHIYANILPLNTVSIPFNSDAFRNILHVNKDMEEGKMYLSYKGLMKLEFKSPNSSSEYHLIRKEKTTF
jgi:hypothetical protein